MAVHIVAMNVMVAMVSVVMVRDIVVVEFVGVRVVRSVVNQVRHDLADLQLVHDGRQCHHRKDNELLDRGDSEQSWDQEGLDAHQLDHDHEWHDEMEVAAATLHLGTLYIQQHTQCTIYNSGPRRAATTMYSSWEEVKLVYTFNSLKN
ncbi:hypothetical protein J6590_055615 [Homalodisca vitripennis]|nr:hypothetical protein J6590_055615 [Homalodisca vitripennis]